MLRGLMMDNPLLISSLLEHAAQNHADTEIVSRTVEGPDKDGTGAKLVLPGAGLDGKSLYELFEAEKVTTTAGVPTVWLGLLAFMKQNKFRFSTLKTAVVGGPACPPAMITSFRTRRQVNC